MTVDEWRPLAEMEREHGRLRRAEDHFSRRGVYTLRQWADRQGADLAIREVLPRFASAGRVGMLVADPKGGKSTLMCALAAAKSAGASLLGCAVEPGDVLIVARDEHPDDSYRRLVGFGADLDRVHITTTLGAQSLEELLAVACDLRPALVVIDTLAAFANEIILDENSSAQWQPVLSGLLRVARESGAAVLILHHATKGNGRSRGSSAITAAVDQIFTMRTDAKDESVRHFEVQGRWAAEDYSLRLTGTGYELVGAAASSAAPAAASSAAPLEERVLAFVTAHPDCSQNAVVRGVVGKESKVVEALRALVKNSRLVEKRTRTARTFAAA